MAAKKRIFVSWKKSRDQNLKKHFFNEIWLKLEDQKYIDIA